MGIYGHHFKTVVLIDTIANDTPDLVLRRLPSYHLIMDIVDIGPSAVVDQFFETPDNPVPDRGRSGFFTARDGRRIRYGLFEPTSNPLCGSVILLGGRNEYIEKYFETIRDLAARGFAVATLDWRGQGVSDRLIRNARKGYVSDFQDYAHDLENLFSEIVLPAGQGPYYVLAHSTGALIALIAASRLSAHIQRMVLCAPLLDIPGHSMRRTLATSTILRCLGLGSIYLGGRQRHPPSFADNEQTSDAVRYQRNIRISETYPGLALDGPTAAWVYALCRACKQVHDTDFMARLRIPMLFIAAGNDSIVSTRAIEKYAQRVKLASVMTIDGARHEIMQEADFFREQFLAAFDAFVTDSIEHNRDSEKSGYALEIDT